MAFGTGSAAIGAKAGLAAVCAAATLLALAPAGLTPGAEPAAPHAPASAATPTVTFSWPLGPPHPVLRGFQPPRTEYGPGHRGVDLGGARGARVLAAGDGVVLYAGRIHDRTLVSVEHSDGLRTTYEPIKPLVRVGERVLRGQVLGRLQLGHFPCTVPGGAQRACLHWGVRRGDTYLDPLRLVSSGAVRLLPWRPR